MSSRVACADVEEAREAFRRLARAALGVPGWRAGVVVDMASLVVDGVECRARFELAAEPSDPRWFLEAGAPSLDAHKAVRLGAAGALSIAGAEVEVASDEEVQRCSAIEFDAAWAAEGLFDAVLFKLLERIRWAPQHKERVRALGEARELACGISSDRAIKAGPRL